MTLERKKFMENKALGKGLSALIPENKQQKAKENLGENVTYLNIVNVQNNSLQPRTNYDNEKLEELKVSIKEKGVLQPILVREKNGQYEVVAGERRLRAARALGLNEVPVIVKSLTDQEALVIALVENIQREELNPIEEAEAFKRLIDDYQYTQEMVAQAVGKDRATVANLLRLLKLPESIQKMVYKGRISVGHARALLSLESLGEQLRLANLVVTKGISVREVEELVKGGGKSRNTGIKKNREKDHEIVALEEDLQRVLGTKVSVIAKKKKGKVVIDYYSLDDLDRILKLLKSGKV